MSAFEPSLLAQLAEQLTATKGMHQIIAICRASEDITCRELRLFAIAMEAVGMTPGERLVERQAAIQRKRDRIERLHGQGWTP